MTKETALKLAMHLASEGVVGERLKPIADFSDLLFRIDPERPGEVTPEMIREIRDKKIAGAKEWAGKALQSTNAQECYVRTQLAFGYAKFARELDRLLELFE